MNLLEVLELIYPVNSKMRFELLMLLFHVNMVLFASKVPGCFANKRCFYCSFHLLRDDFFIFK